MEKYGLVLFDGVCNLCNGAINYLIDHDKHNSLRFASLQSNYAKKMLEKFDVPVKYMDSVIFIKNEKIYVKSGAILEICKQLGGFYTLLYAFWVVPTFLRNVAYDWIARNRYKWFGKREACRMPNAELKAKFLE